jgi:hypothetical protein
MAILPQTIIATINPSSAVSKRANTVVDAEFNSPIKVA